MKQIESPSQTLSRLNQLFTYFEHNTYTCKSLPQGLTIRHFNKFPIPQQFADKEVEFHESAKLITKQNHKSHRENLKLPDTAKNIMSLKQLSIYNINAREYRKKRGQVKKEKSQSHVPSSLQVSPRNHKNQPNLLLRQNSVHITPSNNKRRNAKFEAFMPNPLHSSKWVSELSNKMENAQMRQSVHKRFSSQQEEWQQYYDKTYRINLVNLNLSRETQMQINRFQNEIKETLKN